MAMRPIRSRTPGRSTGRARSGAPPPAALAPPSPSPSSFSSTSRNRPRAPARSTQRASSNTDDRSAAPRRAVRAAHRGAPAAHLGADRARRALPRRLPPRLAHDQRRAVRPPAPAAAAAPPARAQGVLRGRPLQQGRVRRAARALEPVVRPDEARALVRDGRPRRVHARRDRERGGAGRGRECGRAAPPAEGRAHSEPPGLRRLDVRVGADVLHGHPQGRLYRAQEEPQVAAHRRLGHAILQLHLPRALLGVRPAAPHAEPRVARAPRRARGLPPHLRALPRGHARQQGHAPDQQEVRGQTRHPRHDAHAAPPLDRAALLAALARAPHPEPAADRHYDGLSRDPRAALRPGLLHAALHILRRRPAARRARAHPQIRRAPQRAHRGPLREQSPRAARGRRRQRGGGDGGRHPRGGARGVRAVVARAVAREGPAHGPLPRDGLAGRGGQGRGGRRARAAEAPPRGARRVLLLPACARRLGVGAASVSGAPRA